MASTSMSVDVKSAEKAAEGMAARSQGVVRIMTRKRELEKSGVWQSREKKKRGPEPGKLGKKKKKNLHIYTHIRIKRYIQVGTMGRKPGV